MNITHSKSRRIMAITEVGDATRGARKRTRTPIKDRAGKIINARLGKERKERTINGKARTAR